MVISDTASPAPSQCRFYEVGADFHSDSVAEVSGKTKSADRTHAENADTEKYQSGVLGIPMAAVVTRQ